MLKSTGITRKIDELGRVVIPMDTRKALSLEEKDSLDVFLNEESGQIVLQKAANVCLKCQAREHLREIKAGLCLAI